MKINFSKRIFKKIIHVSFFSSCKCVFEAFRQHLYYCLELQRDANGDVPWKAMCGHFGELYLRSKVEV